MRTEALRLPPLIRDLQIDYTALSLVAPEKMRFRYKLEGRDRDWQDVGTRRQAFYTDLPRARYRFRVMAANNSGVWNETGATVDFVDCTGVLPDDLVPGALASASWCWRSSGPPIASASASSRSTEREITALNERLMKAQEQERIRIAGELHDGVMQEMLAVTMMLGTAKRRIADDSDDEGDDRQDPGEADPGGHGHPSAVSRPAPADPAGGGPARRRCSRYCEQFSAEQRHSGRVRRRRERARPVARCGARAFPNRSGSARERREARARQADHRSSDAIGRAWCRSTVSDDGVGFDPGRLGTSGGLGLIMMRERASQLNGTFEFESAPGRGTTIRVVIPFR